MVHLEKIRGDTWVWINGSMGELMGDSIDLNRLWMDEFVCSGEQFARTKFGMEQPQILNDIILTDCRVDSSTIIA